MFPFGESVTVLTGSPVVDPYSGEATSLSWDAPAELLVEPVAIAPRESDEPREDARTSRVVGLTLFMPADAAVTEQDRIRVESGPYAGRVLEVDGLPASWASPYSGWRPGVVVQTRQVEG